MKNIEPTPAPNPIPQGIEISFPILTDALFRIRGKRHSLLLNGRNNLCVYEEWNLLREFPFLTSENFQAFFNYANEMIIQAQ